MTSSLQFGEVWRGPPKATRAPPHLPKVGSGGGLRPLPDPTPKCKVRKNHILARNLQSGKNLSMLTIENLSVNYGQSQIPNDVALRIEQTQVVCLLGRNGVGKTTLLKTIMGLLRPRTGRVVFDSNDVTGM